MTTPPAAKLINPKCCLTGRPSDGSSRLERCGYDMVFLGVYRPILTHGSGSYVGLASWAWFSIERFITVTKRCLYSPACI